MASQAIGRPFDLPNGGRASASIEVVSKRDFRSLLSGKAVRQLFDRTNYFARIEHLTLTSILRSATDNIGTTRYAIEREVITAKGARLTIRISVWVKGATNHAQVGGWLAGIMTQVLSNPEELPAPPQVLCGGVVPGRLETSE